MNSRKVFFSILSLLVLGALASVIIYSGEKPAVSTKYDAFAKCLAAKELSMYGAEWCSHCQAEKARFGDSFQYVPYVECPESPDLCLRKGVTGYPTWIDGKGEKYEGEQGLEKLSELSGCQLPAN